ncbi:MAG: acetyl-CoA carboxylase biotin carboxyl carrier protein subunit [Bdellovibrionales bacterium]|nr:acetyl-CoA carboxylase biotin carboxyl carrier protein subunit [Bdellovibrionales bacterium]
MKTLTLEINGQEQTAYVEKLKGVLWVHMNGKTFTYKPEEVGGEAGGQQVVDPSVISAPMPGKIIKVLKSVGDSVSEGETIVVMEAMKMEYTLTAAADVKIEKVNCSEGQQVSVGEKLVEMEVIDG